MIDDEKIIELFFERSEQGIRELDIKYGKICHNLSYNIVNSRQDAEECVNDAYLGAWNAIPPVRPNPLLSYIVKIVRNISLKIYWRKEAAKRSGHYTIALEEIEGCIADQKTVEDEIEARELARIILIGVWGSGRKEYAAMKLTLMLMGGSAFLLIGILGIYFGSGATTMNLLEIAQLHNIPFAQQCIWFPLTFLGFGVLGALFPFHTWSPDGHASAPTAVSMLHAGVLMKLGGYGCFRIAMYLMPEAANELSWIFLILTGISVVYGAFSACVQTDLKYINAYSSVSHCGLVLFAILMLNQTAATGAILQMLSHGLMTALFFALIGMIYGRTHTRDVRELAGLMKVMPFLSVCYVIAGLANLGLPGLSGFIAEMTIFVGSFQNNDQFHRVLTIIACSSIVITAVYILRLVGKILYGTCTNKHHLELTDATWDERVAVICLIVCVAGLGMAPFWVSHMIGESVLPVVSQLIP